MQPLTFPFSATTYLASNDMCAKWVDLQLPKIFDWSALNHASHAPQLRDMHPKYMHCNTPISVFQS